jgi:hypothetical protein
MTYLYQRVPLPLEFPGEDAHVFRLLQPVPDQVMLSCLVRRSSALASALRFYRYLSSAVFDPYHPERHYMRGPGPRWHQTHPGD